MRGKYGDQQRSARKRRATDVAASAQERDINRLALMAYRAINDVANGIAQHNRKNNDAHQLGR